MYQNLYSISGHELRMRKIKREGERDGTPSAACGRGRSRRRGAARGETATAPRTPPWSCPAPPPREQRRRHRHQEEEEEARRRRRRGARGARHGRRALLWASLRVKFGGRSGRSVLMARALYRRARGGSRWGPRFSKYVSLFYYFAFTLFFGLDLCRGWVHQLARA